MFPDKWVYSGRGPRIGPRRQTSALDARNLEPYTNEYTNCRDHKRVASNRSNYKIHMEKELER